MRPVSKKRANDYVARAKAEQVLGRRNGRGVCARCGLFTDVNGHERLGRAQGGDPTNPDCLLCVECNTLCEDQPETMAKLGWKISGKYDRFPWLDADEAVNALGDHVRFPVVSDTPS